MKDDRTAQAPEQVVAEAIQNARRRYTLYYLHKKKAPVELTDLVLQVAAWENCCQPEDVPVAQRKSVYSALHQTHLPYLEERGIVEFDRETNEIECPLNNSEFELSLANDQRTTVRWFRVNLLVAGVGTVVLAGQVANVPLFDLISPLMLASVLVVSHLILGVFHWYDVHRWRDRMSEMPPDYLISIDRETTSWTSQYDSTQNET